MSARTEATKRKLFVATLALIGEHGMTGLTVDDIAARAGVAKGTVYYNFGSKDGLVDALLRYGVDLLASRLASAGDEDPWQTLSQLVDALLVFFADYPTFAQLLVSELWRTPGQWHATLSLVRDEITSVIRTELQRLADAGRLPDGVQVPTAAAALFGSVLVVALDWQVFQPARTKDEVHESVMLLIRGLRGTP
ncbi:TetR/AcrR family transcriptional regulator [Labedaea rhizosphaerae]|uniref:TetR family transcriptional regulator n=1 Tax=Labedaea rhizosphaerae TaxID=598644 RepID=A0A4R6RYI0_LABRH|nr:TetR/AcrR family transcriptional regulator [Labedaea rhizosphaerae]TDP91924.1 TetR family transcriptional regulator [Labedaea rhizosphaerae]